VAAGKYEVKIDGTSFGKKYVVVEVAHIKRSDTGADCEDTTINVPLGTALQLQPTPNPVTPGWPENCPTWDSTEFISPVSYTVDTSVAGSHQFTVRCGTSNKSVTVNIVKVEIEINNTPNQDDDLVGLNSNAVPCRVRVLGPTANVTVWLTNTSGAIPGKVDIVEGSSFVLPGNGNWVPFSIKGSNTSTIADNAIIKAHLDNEEGVVCGEENLTVVEVAFTPSPLDHIIVTKNAPLIATVLPAVQTAVTFTSNRIEIATVSGTAPNLTVNALSLGYTQVLAKIGTIEIASVDVSTIENKVFSAANATVVSVAPGPRAIALFGPRDGYGLTFPESVNVTFTVGRDGAMWRPIITSVQGSYSQQVRLPPAAPAVPAIPASPGVPEQAALPEQLAVKEVTGPITGNTVAANAQSQVDCLRSLGQPTATNPNVEWYMIQAVVDHENVHLASFLPALRVSTVLPVFETSIEQLNVNSADTDQFAAIAAIEALADFNTTRNSAWRNWLTQILLDVARDHHGPTDEAERAVVNPMIAKIIAAFPGVR
jgi:hypothetical protein